MKVAPKLTKTEIVESNEHIHRINNKNIEKK